MASLPKLPRPDPGYVLKAADIKLMSDAIRRGWVTVADGGGLVALYGENGISLSQAAPAVGPRIMFVTTTIPAKSGDICDPGQAVDAVFDETTNALTAGTGDPVDVRNYHEKSFLEGGIIAAFTRFGVLWAFDIDKCANYQ